MRANNTPMPLTQRYFDLVWRVFCDATDDLINDQRAKVDWSVSAEVYESIQEEFSKVSKVQTLAR